jgi:di/tricarboxylate transporter
MAPAAWLTFAVVIGVVVVLATDRFTPASTLFGAVVILLAAGVVTPAEAFSGFSNPAPITVAALYVLAAAVDKTGALQPILAAVLGRARGQRRQLARLSTPVAGASAFLNNTPIVAMLVPQIQGWCERNDIPVSRYLIPLSFASILGGMVTLIGTSTNIVVSGLLESTGRPGLGMFEMTPVGLPVALLALLAMVLLAPVLLPDRRGATQSAEEDIKEFAVAMRVDPGGALDGATVEDAGLRRLRGLFLVEIRREGESIAPVGPRERLRASDRLTFVGRADQVVELQRRRGLVSTENEHLLSFDAPDHTFFEAVVGHASPLVGNTLKKVGFRGRYSAAVVAIHRAGHRVEEKLGEVRLRAGDSLLLLADAGFRDRWGHRNDFLLVSRPIRSAKAWFVGAVTAGIVASAALGLVSILVASLLGAFALMVGRVLSVEEARAAVNMDVIVVIASAFGLGAAIGASGLADAAAHVVVGGLGVFGTVGLLTGVMLMTVLLDAVITNNASAALMFPIAMSVATEAGGDVRMFAVGLAIAASASFLTPVGYQTNIMVYGPGGYRFSDYARLGLPLTILVIAGAVALLILEAA